MSSTPWGYPAGLYRRETDTQNDTHDALTKNLKTGSFEHEIPSKTPRVTKRRRTASRVTTKIVRRTGETASSIVSRVTTIPEASVGGQVEENCETHPMIKSKDESEVGPAPDCPAVPSTDQQAGIPGNGTITATAGRTTERGNLASKPASVNGRARKGTKQRTRALQRPLLLFTKTRI